MIFRSDPTSRPALRSAVALSILLALGACSSDDDDAGGTTDGGETDGGNTDDGDALDVSLSPDQEVPPVTTAPDASAEASIDVDDDGSEIRGSITVEGLTGPAQMAHVHRGFRGSNGPVVIGLESDDDGTVWTVPDEPQFMNGATPESVAEAFRRGELYFNVHTAANPDGEIRGQIVPEGDDAPTFFTVRIENVSDDQTLPHSGGSSAVPLSPGAYLVHRADINPLLEPRAPAGMALEMVAEDGDPANFPNEVPGSAVFDTPVDATEPGAIGPGGAYEFTVSGVPGDKLSLVTMFVQSNDWFYTPTDEDDSISLFDDDGEPIAEDQSDSLALWDAGTEQDEEPGTGPNQVQRQGAPNTGPAEGGTVGSLESQGKSVTLNGEVIELTVTPVGDASASN